ncbi:hypothetical protein ACPZ19_32825 [Amycolatopsis lurida]
MDVHRARPGEIAVPGGSGTNRETAIDRMEFNSDGTIRTVTPTL